MPAQKSAKSPKSAPDTAAKAASTSKTATQAAPAAKKAPSVPVNKSADKPEASEETTAKKASRAKAAAPAAADDDETPKKRPGRPAKAATAAAGKAPPSAAASPRPPRTIPRATTPTCRTSNPNSRGEVEAEPAEAAPTAEKVKPLRMKISKAKERALMKEFGLDDTVLSEEDLAKRRSRLKALITLGKTRGYLTQVEISDHLPDKLVDAETMEVVVTMLNDMGVAVYEQTPDAETLFQNNVTPPPPPPSRKPRKKPRPPSPPWTANSAAPPTRSACTCARWARWNCSPARARSRSPSASKAACRP